VRLNAFASLVSREWRASWADRLAYGLRSGYAALLLAGVLAVWISLPLLYSGRPETFPDRVRAIFDVFCRVQFGLMTLLASVTFARAVCREQERGTLDLLILSPLTRTEILAGKLAGEFLGLAALVASGVPVLFLLLPLGGISAPQILTLQALVLAQVLAVGGVCVALAALLGGTLPVMVGAWAIVTAWSGGFWAGRWLFPRSLVFWNVWESCSAFAILDEQLGRTVADPSVSLKALGLAAIASLLLCALGGLVLERRHARGRSLGPISRLSRRLRRFAGTAMGVPLFRSLVRVEHPLLRREFSLDRDLAFRMLWLVLIAIYAVAIHVVGAWPWREGEYQLVLAASALAMAVVVAAVEGAVSVGLERRRGMLQVLLAAGVSPEDFVRARTAGLLFRAAALVTLPAVHLIWINSCLPGVPRDELFWRIPIAVVGLIFGVVGLAQTTLRLALSSPRVEIAVAGTAAIAIPLVVVVAGSTGLTLGTFALAVPLWTGTAVVAHLGMVGRVRKWAFK
jgi:hypothetical protein